MNFEGKWPRSLPDVLKPKPGPLSATHLKVYKDFMNLGNADNMVAGDGSGQNSNGHGGSSTSADKVARDAARAQAAKEKEDAARAQMEQQQQAG